MYPKCFLFLLICTITSVVNAQQNNADSMATLFKNNAKNSAIYIIKNDKALMAWNDNETMPIANLSDLLIAIEFGKQATYKLLDSGQRVSLKEVVKYNIENKYQPEYENWLTDLLMQQKITDVTASVSLMDIVKGMHQYGVQANAEYLLDKVGYSNVKSSIVSYNMNGHTTLAMPMGSLALYQNRAKVPEKKMLKAIADLDEDGYAASANLMHLALQADSSFKVKMPTNFITEKVMKLWSNNLPQGTVKSYANLLQTIVKEKMLDAKMYKMLRSVFEPNGATMPKQYTRYMVKKSTTINTFAQAQYCKTIDGKEAIIVYTLANLTPAQVKQLNKWHTDFDKALIENPEFIVNFKTSLLTNNN
jgi:hypothetical protein